ncbi:MAG: hypothetical protein ABIP97_04090 [Chthoniobacterales bacterium]
MNTPTENQEITVGQWIITFILQAIPIVGIVMIIIWAIGNNVPVSKRNYARAILILLAVVIVIGIVVGLLGGLAGLAMAKHQSELLMQLL